MKKRIFFYSLILAMVFGVTCLQVCAAPFLICDPPDSAEQVVSYLVYQDGALIGTADAEADGSLKYDLVNIAPGVYSWTAKAVNAWGASELSDPYISPSAATPPQATRMVP